MRRGRSIQVQKIDPEAAGGRRPTAGQPAASRGGDAEVIEVVAGAGQLRALRAESRRPASTIMTGDSPLVGTSCSDLGQPAAAQLPAEAVSEVLLEVSCTSPSQ